jgi:hypothetical protein
VDDIENLFVYVNQPWSYEKTRRCIELLPLLLFQ